MNQKIFLKSKILGLLIFVFYTSSFSLNAQNYCQSSPVDVHGSLSVLGNKIVDQNNESVSFAGNSFFWSNSGWGAEKYYNADVVNWLANDWNSMLVRAAMGVEDNGGYLGNPVENKNRVKAVVDAAIAKGMYVIIDWHSHHAEDNPQAAIDFFKEMAQTYGDNPHVIYEIYNEPLQVSWSNTIKPYATAVISAIRAIDPDNLIIVGTPTWSQDVDVASMDPINGDNIAYTLHFYAATHKENLRRKAQTALDNGIALMVTEWGSVQANGSGAVDYNSTDEWMRFLSENDITHANWSITDKNEGSAVLIPGASSSGGWSDSMLTDSGKKVKEIVQNWKQYCDDNGSSNNLPNVSITSPASDSNLPTNTLVTITATANDSDGSITSVEFFVDGQSIGIDTSSPYSLDWTPTLAAQYELTAVAKDNENGVRTSASVQVTVADISEGIDCSTIEIWNAQAVYPTAGMLVVHKNKVYRNNWYTSNQNPDTNSGQWQVWSFVEACANTLLEQTNVSNDKGDPQQKVYVSPNPSAAEFKVDFASQATEGIIEVFTLTGELLFKKVIKQDEKTSFTLANYNDGMYVLKLISATGTITKVIVKKSI
ncbi:cellulase family glycosylhydrolase [Aquimarina sp. W85]|uniref:cellulase family glycosylhydrolase n=1 Tax=Aquimarina rhodophyticola TaxID=3342246 RepID=UPI00366F1D9F